MRGLQTDRTAQVVIASHAFVQNLRRGHYELGIDARPRACERPRPSPNSPKRSDHLSGWAQRLGSVCRLILQRIGASQGVGA
jgi:hypothetical protein